MIYDPFFSIDDDLNIILLNHRRIRITLMAKLRRHDHSSLMVVVHVIAEGSRLREVWRTLGLLNLPHIVLMTHLLLITWYLLTKLIFFWGCKTDGHKAKTCRISLTHYCCLSDFRWR